MSEELTFDEVAEFLGKAGAEAGQQLLLTLLQDALNEIKAMRIEIAALAAKSNQYNPPPVYGGAQGGGWVTKGTSAPIWYDQNPNTVYASTNTVQTVRNTIQDFYDYEYAPFD